MPAKLKIMLLGAGGQMGKTLLSCPTPDEWQWIAYDRASLDITNHNAVRVAVANQEPDLIINCAAQTNIEEAEKNEAEATEINFHGPANLAAQCSTRDIPLIHLSSAYVFDGFGDTPFKPDDLMNPLNIYGKTKLLGEEALRQELAWHVIVRFSHIFSLYGKNILTKALRLLDQKIAPSATIADTIAPTCADDAAAVLIHIAKEVLSGRSDGFGVFHFCGAPAVQRKDFYNEITDTYACCTKFKAQAESFAPAADQPQAPRPPYTVLDCEKIRRIYGLEPSDWHEGLKTLIQRHLAERKD